MPKRYHLRLNEDGDPDGPGHVRINLHGDAFEVLHWLLSSAVTITEDDPKAREQLYRLAVVQVERLSRDRHDT